MRSDGSRPPLAIHNNELLRDFHSSNAELRAKVVYSYAGRGRGPWWVVVFGRETSVSLSGPYRPPGGVEEMQGGGRRVRLEWGAYITV
ncbi:hypothetical protein FHG87_005152 [Trinorchestia longiramus]|nr:hypothetical protein FHG87_005152 [Trinorchestia longiramus]